MSLSADRTLSRFGDWLTVTRGTMSVRCTGYVREIAAESLANSADKAPAIFVLEAEPLKSMGVHKFDKIIVHDKTYTVIDASIRYAGSEPVVIKGTCSS